MVVEVEKNIVVGYVNGVRNVRKSEVWRWRISGVVQLCIEYSLSYRIIMGMKTKREERYRERERRGLLVSDRESDGWLESSDYYWGWKTPNWSGPRGIRRDWGAFFLHRSLFSPLSLSLSLSLTLWFDKGLKA